MRTFTLVFLTAICGAAPLVDNWVELGVARSLYDTPISYPVNCTGAEKPATEPFCVVGSFNTSVGSKLNITVYIFNVGNLKKSVNFHIEIANNNTSPTGLNITGGGSAKVVKKEELFGAVELSVTVSAATIGDGRGKYDPSTGRYLADIKVNADAKASALDYDVLDLPVSKVVTAHIGPNYDFGLEAIFKESTGDSDDAGISIAFDLTMNTKNHDLFTWDLVGEAGQIDFPSLVELELNAGSTGMRSNGDTPRRAADL
ncbi:hypothetical protein FOZ60_009208 [Perkinsus olseni]|uniref:Uncharacterized protein n=1 Tax=Perkinsus olseni TaxID=32597 RepID=A0A7J6PEB3_PEROL|nr:hypothetical protein FOZ60_009208 [Perkinsus olseni]